MTIDLEGVRAVLCRQMEIELNATVTGSVHSERQRGEIREVTFDLWIERNGTRINRHLYIVMRLALWSVEEFQRSVKMFCDTRIRPDLVKQQSRDFLAKSGMN